MSETKAMISSIFVDQEGNEVDILAWGSHYIHYIYCNSKLAYFTPKKKFLKEFEQKEEENEQL